MIRHQRVMQALLRLGIAGFDRHSLCDALFLGVCVIGVHANGQLFWRRWAWGFSPDAPWKYRACGDCGATVPKSSKTCYLCTSRESRKT